MTSFVRAVAHLGLAEAVAEDLRARYSEGHRRYHNLEHLEEVLAGLPEADDEILLAALFHDAVYDPTRSDNEACSAALMREAVPTASDRAVGAILATQTHQTSDPGILALLDADLAVLGRPESGYEAYARQIREEYAHVPDEAYAKGRSAVLQSFLARPAIYRTSAFVDLEERARGNLCREIARLTSPPAG